MNVAVNALCISIIWTIGSRPKTRTVVSTEVFCAGLAAVIIACALGEGFYLALYRIIGMEIGWLLAFIIAVYLLQKLPNKVKGKSKHRQNIEFDGEVFPIVDEDVNNF